MAERVFLVHGWSVTETTTYQALHLQLAGHGFQLEDIHLGRYVSLDNEVDIPDIALAMHKALVKILGRPPWTERFHIITHSTGALVTKHWVAKNYIDDFAKNKPLKNLVFLAGPHFGSRLAHHGRSMLAEAAYFGPTGKRVLNALELGSSFSWENNGVWLEQSTWREKGIRPFCLIGNKVEGGWLNSAKAVIFPAGFETGSDMVVRVPAGNLNFRRFNLNAAERRLSLAGEIRNVPFAALWRYAHSGANNGIMNNIKKSARANLKKYQNLRLILDCLEVTNATKYKEVGKKLARATKETHKKDQAFAQLDFRFRDQHGVPINDYRLELGVVENGREVPAKTVAHTHKNQIEGNHFTVFLNLKNFHSKQECFLKFSADTGTPLADLLNYRVMIPGKRLLDIIAEDQTTQIDVTLRREPDEKLFVFHAGNDPQLHVKWNREGEIVDDKIQPK